MSKKSKTEYIPGPPPHPPIIPAIQQASLEKMAADLARLHFVEAELRVQRQLNRILMDRLGGTVVIDKVEFTQPEVEVNVIDRGMVVEFRVKR